MKTRLWIILMLSVLLSGKSVGKNYIRINQLGYLPKTVKVAVILSEENIPLNSFQIYDFFTRQKVFDGNKITSCGNYGQFTTTYRLDFTSFTKPGSYYIKVGVDESPVFRLSDGVYNQTADFLLRYMREQRSGYNPVLKDSCHTQDGYIIYQPEKEGQHIDVSGGWHDASDYLQYVTTSANATYQLLFAYEQHPAAFNDLYQANGLPGANGTPDILDEALWGVRWLMKMNPADSILYNQLADDRDHAGFRPPTKDNADYGKGKERPVYFCTGKPQGLFKHQNRTTGIASTAGKYASVFALASKIFQNRDTGLSTLLLHKAKAAYEFGKVHPGVCQTAPCKSPYFYEEDNWTDDMELAAVQLYKTTGNRQYLTDAIDFGRQEPVTPWMGADTARHYQWYPFVNLGHYLLATDKKNGAHKEFISNLKKGIDNVARKAANSPFLYGIPNIWCSNNLVAAMLTQCHLYNKLTGDHSYLEMEAALRDWLFGCNPWGKCMIVGLPEWGDYPRNPHSAISKELKIRIDGGLVDGPVYNSIYSNLKGLVLLHPDQYVKFQTSRVVYHDDLGDYSTNEPTMDGTASLSYYFSSLQNNENPDSHNKEVQGAICRFNPNKKVIYLSFSGHQFANEGAMIEQTLKKHKIKANFFFTGDFYRNPAFKTLIHQLYKDGHYLGPHSGQHPLYADWNKRDSLLIDFPRFVDDLNDNYEAMKQDGINPDKARIFLPPYEWYNQTISNWCQGLGVQLINFTPGTYSNADYTIPSEKNYRTSDFIVNKIKEAEQSDPHGLNGAVLLMHIGADPHRTDLLCQRLDDIIRYLQYKGYRFERFSSYSNDF